MELGDEIEVRSSLGQWKDFIEGTVWFDFKNQLNLWLSAIRDELEKCPMSEFKKFQARAEMIRDIVVLPDLIVETLELDREHEDDKKGQEDIFENFNDDGKE